MYQPLISVIVPIYNVENYLNKCIGSIVSQTYKNLEIILVNDGSFDNCPNMCDEWAARDSRIKVIHKENGGAGLARNIGLDIAKGEYISFVDSDDMINCNLLSTLYEIAAEQNADIVECEYSTNENIMLFSNLEKITFSVYDSQSAMLENVHDKLFKQVIWNKLYKNVIIKDIRFVKGKVIDDEFWTYKAIGNANKLIHVQKELYFYRQQDKSLMHQQYSLKRLEGIEAHVERIEYINLNYPEIYEQSLVQLWIECRYHGQMALRNLDDKDIKKVFEYLNKIINCYSLQYNCILHQKFWEILWLVLEKMSLKTVCKIRNVLKKGL